MLNQLQNWIMRNLVFSYRSLWSSFKLILLGGVLFLMIYRFFLFIYVHNGVLVKTQGYIGVYEWLDWAN